MEKDKAIFIGVLGTVLLALIIYTIFAFGKKDQEHLGQDSFEAPSSSMEDTKEKYTSRIDALTKDRYETPQKENPLRYDFLEDDKDEQEKKSERDVEKETINKKAQHTLKKRTPKNKSTQKSVPQTPLEVPLVAEPTVEVRYGFTQGNGQTHASGVGEYLTKKNNLWAQLDDKVVVSDHSHQVFLLENTAIIIGRDFPANSKLYTQAEVKNDFIDIRVVRIKDINTHEEYSVDMYAVNEDRSRGIKYQGKTNKETDKTSKDILSETSRVITRKLNVNKAIEAAGDGLEEIAGRDQVEVPIDKGYRLIFIENKSQ